MLLFFIYHDFTTFGHSASRWSPVLIPPQSSLLPAEGKDRSWKLASPSDIVWETGLLSTWLHFPLLFKNRKALVIFETGFLKVLVEYKLLISYKEMTRFNKDIFSGAGIEHFPSTCIVPFVPC